MSDRMNYNAVSPVGTKALGTVYGYVPQSGLPLQLTMSTQGKRKNRLLKHTKQYSTSFA